MRVSRASAKERGYGFVAIKQTNSNRVHGPNDESIYHFFFIMVALAGINDQTSTISIS